MVGVVWMRRVLDLEDVSGEQVGEVGGKAANLGELARLDGIRVPAGFCVTTGVFRTVVMQAPAFIDLLDRLSGTTIDDGEGVRQVSAQLRDLIEDLQVPDELASDVGDALAGFAPRATFAVRSSATAEDLPGASFAGQHDSELGVSGLSGILDAVRRCWASLFSDRAVAYRLRSGFDHRKVEMAVVVQQMVRPDVAGVMFTADPVTSNRTVTTVEAVRGLGEALVSGLVDPDIFRVRGEDVVETRMAAAGSPVLTDAQVRELVGLGRRIEAAFGDPQDIEWCLVDARFEFVQSRPITTLFPVPQTTDGGNHVYVSVGHQQMMTDAMTPLGLSIWQLTTMKPMAEAGGRLFVDVSGALASSASRDGLLAVMGRGDPLIRDALQTLLDRGGFIRTVPEEDAPPEPAAGSAEPLMDADPAVVTELINRNEASVARLERDITGLAGPALFEFLVSAFAEDVRVLFDPRGLSVIMAGMRASWWLNDQLADWLGERNAADTLTLSVEHNVTSEMGLELLGVADAIRPFPQVVTFLQELDSGGTGAGGSGTGGSADDRDHPLAGMSVLEGGDQALAAIGSYLDRFGMRCPGEIDISRTRWSEDPALLVPAILTALRTSEHGAGQRRFEQGRQRALEMETDLLQRVRALPDGPAKALEVKQMIDRVRTFSGYREYPKYGKIARLFVYKRALLRTADELVRRGVLQHRDDIHQLRFDELHAAVLADRSDPELSGLIERRTVEFRAAALLRPPRVLTSEGECLDGAYRRDDLPLGALAGVAVSAGIVEGRARIVSDMTQADLEPGDILVTHFTDPSWTPLFVAVAGLVTEVGGAMTHGAVIAREYGLPAVVGVQHATRLIRDGQQIRVHGAVGYVELLP